MSELMDLVVDCENQLGWSGPAGVPPWKARVAEVGRLRRVLNSRPEITVQDLRLALAWCKRRKEPINSTVELFTKVQDARRQRVQEQLDPATISHREAMGWEQSHPDAESERWLARLVRSFGPTRAQVLADWRAAGRGPGAQRALP